MFNNYCPGSSANLLQWARNSTDKYNMRKISENEDKKAELR